jgi:hypothetical protein
VSILNHSRAGRRQRPQVLPGVTIGSNLGRQIGNTTLNSCVTMIAANRFQSPANFTIDAADKHPLGAF